MSTWTVLMKTDLNEERIRNQNVTRRIREWQRVSINKNEIGKVERARQKSDAS